MEGRRWEGARGRVEERKGSEAEVGSVGGGRVRGSEREEGKTEWVKGRRQEGKGQLERKGGGVRVQGLSN